MTILEGWSPGGSFGRGRRRLPGRGGTNPSTAIVRMPSAAMTPIAMLARGRIHIRCCALLRSGLATRLSHRRILRHCNGRQCADNQGAAYKVGYSCSPPCVAPDPNAEIIRQLIDALAARKERLPLSSNDPNTVPGTKAVASAMMQVRTTSYPVRNSSPCSQPYLLVTGRPRHPN